MFALSSMTGMNITTVYPEIIGKETKYSTFLNTYEIFEYNIPLEQHILQFLVNLFKILLWSTAGIVVLPGLDIFLQAESFCSASSNPTEQRKY
jgi:hypothetical protein